MSNFIQKIHRAPWRPALSLNIRMSSGSILRHLLNSWTIQGVYTHTQPKTDIIVKYINVLVLNTY